MLYAKVGPNWEPIGGSPISSQSGVTVKAVRVYTTSDTWTKPADLVYVEVQVQGAGGGSGGCGATAAAQSSASGGGGGGGYARKVIVASALGATETITVGIGGTAGAATPTTGGQGGASMFGAHCTGNGGAGGQQGTSTAYPNTSNANGGGGASATGGDVNIQGGYGRGSDLFINRQRRAPGGSSVLGPAGDDNNAITAAGGTAGKPYGGGAAGAFCPASSAAQVGAVGADGVVIVTEYCTTVTGSVDLDQRYVNTTGDTMTGPLTMTSASSLGQHLNFSSDPLYGIGLQPSTLYFRSGNDFYWYDSGVHSDTAGAPGAGGVELMNLNSTGQLNVGKGGTNNNPLALHGGGTDCYIQFFPAAGSPRSGYVGQNGGWFRLYSDDSGALIQAPGQVRLQSTGDTVAFYCNNAFAAMFNTIGDFLVSKSAISVGTVGHEVRADGQFMSTLNTVGGRNLYLNHIGGSDATGQLFASFLRTSTTIGSITQTATPGVAFNTSSDYRLKTERGPIVGALERLGRLRPLRVTWNEDENQTEVDAFLAHEVAEVVPLAVTGDKDAVDEDGEIDPQQLDYSKLVPLLVAAVQEQADTIKSLTARIAVLEAS